MSKDFYKTLGIAREDIRSLADKYGIQKLAVFGSFARGEQTADSDIDILAEWKTPPGLGRYMGFIEDMEALAGRKVDIATPKSLHWYIRDRVLKEARAIL